MKAKTTLQTLVKALRNTNKKHGYQLIWNRQPEKHGNYYHFTIKSKTSKVHGASVSWSGRNSPAASWEAHGNFFDEMLALDQDAVIKTAKATITAAGGNWTDYNIGSTMQPFYASENGY